LRLWFWVVIVALKSSSLEYINVDLHLQAPCSLLGRYYLLVLVPNTRTTWFDI
jgi:hypothetical protein